MKAHGGEKYMLEMRELDRLAYTKQGSLSIEYLSISDLRLQLGDTGQGHKKSEIPGFYTAYCS